MGPDRTDSGTGSLPSVCVVTHPLGFAGENATRTLLDVLAALTTVSVVTAELDPESVIREEFEVTEITDKGTGTSTLVAAVRFLLNQMRMCRVLGRRDEEVVLFFGATSYLLPIAYARAAGKTVVLEPRGDVPLTLRLHWEERIPDLLARALAGSVWALERAGYRLADAVITYTPSMAAGLDLDGYGSKLYTDGARYIDTDAFAPAVPFEKRESTAGFVGRLDEEKGIRTLVDVARRLPDGIGFRFVGDGDLRPWLEDELADEIAAGDVSVTGWVDHDEVPTQLNELQLLVMPSDATEGLPTTILEGLACGTPVYATPVAGVPDVVRDGETGFLMRDRSADAIAADVAAILERDNLADISRGGRRLIESTYSFGAAVERYRRILESLPRPEDGHL